jgi:lysyl-tRNA synthetase class 1
MIKKDNFEKTSAWPFVEAKKMLRERKAIIEKKGKITLQTGYGPSGLPHIGTFGEVARTSMMVNALNQLSDLPTEIITFSDDMDGLRKVPENVPQKDLLEKNYKFKTTSDTEVLLNYFIEFGEKTFDAHWLI